MISIDCTVISHFYFAQEAFFQAFTEFPKYSIIWRLGGQLPSGIEQHKNIKVVKWIPQGDLLRMCNNCSTKDYNLLELIFRAP